MLIINAKNPALPPDFLFCKHIVIICKSLVYMHPAVCSMSKIISLKAIHNTVPYNLKMSKYKNVALKWEGMG